MIIISDCSEENGNPNIVASANHGCEGSKFCIICSFVVIASNEAIARIY